MKFKEGSPYISEAQMARTVTIASGAVFETLKAAKNYFAKLRESTPVGTRLSEPEKSNVLDVYNRYCTITAWKAEDAIEVTTSWENSKRADGTFAQTKAFAVITGSGTTHIFSIDKALAKIAV